MYTWSPSTNRQMLRPDVHVVLRGTNSMRCINVLNTVSCTPGRITAHRSRIQMDTPSYSGLMARPTRPRPAAISSSRMLSYSFSYVFCDVELRASTRTLIKQLHLTSVSVVATPLKKLDEGCRRPGRRLTHAARGSTVSALTSTG